MNLITPTQARAIVAGDIAPIADTETLPLADALGRIAATTVGTPQPLPRFDHAAVDGYGLGPPGGEPGYRLVSEIVAGRPCGTSVKAGEAVRVATGAPVPAGVTTVVMHEACRVEDGRVFIDGPVACMNIRRRGEDIAAGETLIAAGTPIAPRHVAALAAAGVDRVAVRRRITVAVLSTGDELRRGGEPAGSSQIYDSNGPMLLALLRRPWIEGIDGGMHRDDRGALSAALAELAERADVVITSGGAGGSATDVIADAIGAAGGAARALRIAQRPGKPLVAGTLAGVPVLGLPGNSVAALVSFLLYGEPLLHARAGAAPHTPRAETAIVASAFSHPPGRWDFVLSNIRAERGDGQLVIEPIANSGSASLGALIKADGLMEAPASTGELPAGSRVAFHRFDLPFHGHRFP